MYIYFFLIMSFIFGAIMGSFLHVLASRYRSKKGITGRSHCLSCGKTLAWYELIPIISFLIQKGKCRTCSARIPRDVFWSELLTAFIFLLISARAFILGQASYFFSTQYHIASFFLFLVFSLLMVIFWYDFHYKIIPDELSYAFSTLAFLSLFFFSFSNGVFLYQGFHYPRLGQVLAGAIVPLPFFLIWVVSKGRWIGLGDPKLMIGIGFLLGISLGFSAVMLSFWIAFLWLIFFALKQILFKDYRLEIFKKKDIMKVEVPFGPFLILGTLFVIITSLNLFQF